VKSRKLFLPTEVTFKLGLRINWLKVAALVGKRREYCERRKSAMVWIWNVSQRLMC
jgi:hypothetical protein